MKGLSPFEAGASAFTAALEEAARDLAFIRSASETRKVLGEILWWDKRPDFRWNFEVTTDFLAKSPALDAAFRGILVVIAGSYEEFIRQIIRSIVREINLAKSGYAFVSARLVKNNRLKTAEAIRALENPRDHYRMDADTLCLDLGSCHSNSSEVRFNEEAFAFDVSNVNEQRLDDIFEKLDLPFQWDRIGDYANLARCLGTRNVRETSNAAKEFVNEFIRRRNSVAHVGIGGAAITPGYVSDAIAFFDRFGEALMIALERELTRKIAAQKKLAASKVR